MRNVRFANTERVPASTLAAEPTPWVADDPVARCLLRRAQGAFQKWPEGFRGFRALVRGETTAGAVSGVISVASPSHIQVECSDALVFGRLEDLLRTLVEQRMPRFFDEGDGRFPVTFASAPADAHGRAIDVHAPATALRYWVDAAIRIRRIERVARGRRVVTTFDEIVRATPGRVLPARTTISTWDLGSGIMLGSETVDDRHRRVEHTWLPLSRRIAVSTADGAPSITLSIEDHQLL
jgi:hypothetical protein